MLFASEPMITNPTNIAVDARGRVWVCDVVNYRGNNGKRPEGDRILILEDSDGDGSCDGVDICPGFDDYFDIDRDSLPNGCDNCSYQSNPDQVDRARNRIRRRTWLMRAHQNRLEPIRRRVPRGSVLAVTILTSAWLLPPTSLADPTIIPTPRHTA